jgi:hypothetical protein
MSDRVKAIIEKIAGDPETLSVNQWMKIVANLDADNQQLAESRKQLVRDITEERGFLGRQIATLQTKNDALEERMKPFLKREESNTHAEQLKIYNEMMKAREKKPDLPQQKRKVKKKTRRQYKRKVTQPVSVISSVDTHML